MRKLFVLFLLVSLVPFTVGCNGLWDFDDDDDVYAASRAAVTVVPSVTLPGTLVAPSLRAQQDYRDVALVYNGVSYYPTAISAVDANGNYTLTYPAITIDKTVTVFNTTTGEATLSLTLVVAGQTIPVSIKVTDRSTATTAVNNETLTVDVSGGNITVTVTSDGTTLTPTPVVTKQYITSVKYGTTSVSINSSAPTTVNSLTPSFTVFFDQDVTAITAWTVTVKNVGTGNSFDLTSTNNAALFTTSTNGKAVTVKVVGATGYALKANSTYEVQFTGGTVNGDALAAGSKRYIKTLATPTAATTLTTVSNNTTTALLTAAANQYIDLTFSAAVAVSPTDGMVTISRYPTLNDLTNNTNVELTTTLASSNSKVSFAFQGTGNTTVRVTFADALVANKFYKVTYTSGAWLDANGYPVEVAAPITFGTN